MQAGPLWAATGSARQELHCKAHFPEHTGKWAWICCRTRPESLVHATEINANTIQQPSIR